MSTYPLAETDLGPAFTDDTISAGAHADKHNAVDEAIAKLEQVGSVLLFSSIASSSVIASTTAATAFDVAYTVPAGLLNIPGLELAYEMNGLFGSVAGSSIFTMIARLGGQSIAAAFLQPATSSDLRWEMRGSIITRTTGATASLQRGMGNLTMAPNNLALSVHNGTITADLTASLVADVTAQHSVSNANNKIQLDSLRIHLRKAFATA
jgi:hypothetical protein